jgi:hypothetical protein
MSKHNLLLASFLAIASVSFAGSATAGSIDEQANSVSARADAQVEKISADLAKYIGEIDRAIAMAKSGGYGKLERGSEARLAEARQTIGELLKDVRDPRDLPPDQRIALFNAHETIESVINKQDKNRVVCTRERKTGSRVATTECLTVAEREERNRISQAITRDSQRMTCSPGETSICSR